MWPSSADQLLLSFPCEHNFCTQIFLTCLRAASQPVTGQGEAFVEEGEEYEDAVDDQQGGEWLTSSQRADALLKQELPQPTPTAAVGNLDILPMLLEQIEAHILYYGRI